MPLTSAIIFDLDDTLYPERAFAFSGFAAVAEAFRNVLGEPHEAIARMRELFDTGHRGRVFNEILYEQGMAEDTDLIQRMIHTYRTHKPAISLFSDADAALARFKSTHKLGLLTDGPAVMQRAKINALGLVERVEAVLVTDELGAAFAKPSRRGFQMAAERLGVGHAACMYVADNPTKDFVAPNALGWKTVRIVRPEGIYAGAPTAENGEPEHTIVRLDELDPLLP